MIFTGGSCELFASTLVTVLWQLRGTDQDTVLCSRIYSRGEFCQAKNSSIWKILSIIRNAASTHTISLFQVSSCIKMYCGFYCSSCMTSTSSREYYVIKYAHFNTVYFSHYWSWNGNFQWHYSHSLIYLYPCLGACVHAPRQEYARILACPCHWPSRNFRFFLLRTLNYNSNASRMSDGYGNRTHE